jgi:hypothetical protein
MSQMKNSIFRAINRPLHVLGLSLVPRRSLLLTHQHDYGTGGYEKYRQAQVFHNKRKINEVWADARTLGVIAAYIREHVPVVRAGICHGTRRGYEQAELSRLLGCPVIGTEISDSAAEFEHTVQWDFHEPKPEWVNRFSFVYSNSIDQAFDPERALATWSAQLAADGLLFLEHSMQHSPAAASEMDPFGAHPMVMPYLLFKWGRGKYRLVDILELAHDKKRYLWIFVIRRVPEEE